LPSPCCHSFDQNINTSLFRHILESTSKCSNLVFSSAECSDKRGMKRRMQ
jgi:hypothetical protein